MNNNKHLKFAKKLTTLLDNQFELFGYKFGLDPIIGLVPILGDIIPAGVSIYLIWLGNSIGMPKKKLLTMGAFAGLDVLIGFIPFIGDFTDIIYRSHKRSMDMINDHLTSFESRVLEGELAGEVGKIL
jgi:hypothetical protein